jgi:hypothetical protein
MEATEEMLITWPGSKDVESLARRSDSLEKYCKSHEKGAKRRGEQIRLARKSLEQRHQ